MAEGGTRNPRKLLEGAYNAQAEADATAAEEARQKELISGVTSAGKGATTFAELDKFLTDNPDLEYFRIDNGGKIGSARTYDTPYGQWSDNSAAIVGTDLDKKSRDIFRYANISAASVRTGKRGETPTVGIQYTPSEFYKANGLEYKTDYGMILSRKEYGDLKQQASDAGMENFTNPTQSPTFSSQYGKEANETILTGASDERRAGLSTDDDDSLAAGADDITKTQRSLLG